MKSFLKQLEDLPYFTTGTLAQYFNDSHKARVYLSRWVKSWDIKRLKQWYYVTTRFFEKSANNKTLDSWRWYMLTHVLYPQSYISSVEVLSLYQIIPEQVFASSLVTLRNSTKIINNIFHAYYRHIKLDFFWWWHTIDKWYWYRPYTIAYPEKALIDWLWLMPITRELSWFKELRLTLINDVFDVERFESYIKRCNSPKMTRILSFIQQLDDYWTDF